MDATQMIRPSGDNAGDSSGGGTNQNAAPSGPQTRRHKRLDQVLKGRYRVEALIASGGMSDVYRAVDQYLERAGAKDCQVAVKILRSALTQDTDALSLLAREAAKSMRLSHPNIIRVNELDQDSDTWFMVMELLDGEPLSRIIQRAKPRGLSWRGAQSVIEQMVDALHYSHQQGIVHADLKPSNVFFTREGRVKLLDFGVARALNPQRYEDFLNPRQEDETTVYGYTPAYASPSVIAGKDPGADDDVYALACIAYELLSSRHPFDRKELTAEERTAYKLQRPKAMPRHLWRLVRRVLTEATPGIDLAEFRKAMAPSQWQRALVPAASAAAVSLALIGGYATLDATLLSTPESSTLTERFEAKNLLNDEASPEELLSALEELGPLESAALLKHQEERLVNHYVTIMDEALGSLSPANLTRIPEILTMLDQARQHYPYNATLARHGEQMHQQLESLERALTDEVRGRLAQGDYATDSAVESLLELARNLDNVRETPLELSGQAVSRFRQNLETALNQGDEAELARLLKVADAIFSDSEALSDLIAKAHQQQDLIAAFGTADWRSNGEEFPEEAAKSFFQPRIENWQETLAGAADVSELDAIYRKLSPLREQIPTDFKPIARVRQKLANAYMEQARVSLDNNQTAAARPMLEKANALMSWGN